MVLKVLLIYFLDHYSFHFLWNIYFLYICRETLTLLRIFNQTLVQNVLNRKLLFSPVETELHLKDEYFEEMTNLPLIIRGLL